MSRRAGLPDASRVAAATLDPSRPPVTATRRGWPRSTRRVSIERRVAQVLRDVSRGTGVARRLRCALTYHDPYPAPQGPSVAACRRCPKVWPRG